MSPIAARPFNESGPMLTAELLGNLFTTSNLQLFLMIGSGILAITLLVLALTRWGQSRPVWKCVFLSFCAHILLMAYAYGTHLIFETPEVTVYEDPLRVNLVDDSGDSAVHESVDEVSLKPWNDFVSQQPLPTVDDLERPAIDSQIVIERLVAPIETPSTAAESLDLPDQNNHSIEIASPLDPSSDQTVTNEIDAPQLPVPDIEVHRRGENDVATAQPEFDTDQELNRAELDDHLSDFKPEALEIQPQPAQNFQGEFQSSNAELARIDPRRSSEDGTVVDPQFKPIRTSRAPNHMKLVSRTRRLGDGAPMPKVYSLRNMENRFEIARSRGGSLRTEQAVNDALRWLAENQEGNGRWDSQKWGGGKETKVFGHDRKGAGSNSDSGITALATLAFLGAGHTHLEGPYQEPLRSALEFLVRHQTRDGNLAGEARLFARMYCHSMALLALSEAYALTGDQRLLAPVQRGVDYSVQAQSRTDGGWRYQPGDAGDMSQFGWQVLALQSADLGGAVVPQSSFNRMRSFLKRCSSGVGGGLASYRPGQGPSTTMTAEALLCRFVLNRSVPPTTVMEATRRINQERPTPHHVNLYYWYYGTLAMYHAGGSDWENWNNELKNTLIPLQETDGPNAGSYPPNGIWGGYGGRVYSTAMATLNLEVYYRYLPMYDLIAQEENDARFR